MTIYHRIVFFLFIIAAPSAFAAKNVSVTSPDKNIVFRLEAGQDGLVYRVSYKGKVLIDNSRLSISFKNGGEFGKNVTLGKPVFQKMEETYDLIIGRSSHVHSLSNDVMIPLTEAGGLKRQLNIEIRIFNDGAAFRYVMPAKAGWDKVEITDETDQFNFTGDPIALTLFRENYTTSHEGLYDRLPVSKIKPDTLMDMPALFEYANGVYMAITEANLLDYAGMYLIKHNGVVQSALSPLPHQKELKVIATLPHNSPWRVMMISDRAGAFIESNILTNLSEPCRIKDLGWIKPGKTTFPWWNGNVSPDTSWAPGNNYDFNMYYTNFCAKYGLGYHTVVEYGLHEWYVNDGEGFQPGPHADPSKAVPGLDMQQLCDSAKKIGVGIRVWVHFYALYPKLDETFAQYEKWGIKGLMCDFMDRDDQEMVNMQTEILEKAAQHHLHIQFHGAYKPTGTARTYPNEFTREGTLNYENDKWNTIVTPDADVNIAFTRLLAGSTDYHLGGFRAANLKTFKQHYTAPMVLGTRCHMLGMYVVLENEQGMVCDYPDAYIGQQGFEFLQQVPLTWDETKVLNAKVSDYVTVARRKGDEWYIGTISNNTAHDIKTSLSFLPAGNYIAEIYSDAPDAGTTPDHLVKVIRQVTNQSVIDTKLVAGGGQVMRVYKAK
ncbi:glycoside hydrolase family 97 protein [Mucilaginibacter sp.]|jgi:alpha-glucosidase|uniref:glycoside hydrolase family 97 protein n=1 Tax=Mucilaginibacter sp. TaxID=1882438 RepID=UPI002BB0B186|nr:glycoside hydrolase family 97 protein [Mucilaginibacter sp.]HTI58601.1 glycoside hydrolase family 97 protein [Mucilaginibacter sp.]